MAFESGALDATLAAAAGDDAALLQELRMAFRDSLAHQVDLLGRARCDGNWNVSAMRLKGLGASFHAETLIDLAEEDWIQRPATPRSCANCVLSLPRSPTPETSLSGLR